jgi:alkylation response protein AidB-like acyl-CoA dehydrogenase
MSAVAEQKQIVKGGAFLIEERTPDEIFTPEDFTEEHRMIAETTRQFIDNEVIRTSTSSKSTIGNSRASWWKKAADLGLIGANIPKSTAASGSIKRVVRWSARTSAARFVRHHARRGEWHWTVADHLLRD